MKGGEIIARKRYSRKARNQMRGYLGFIKKHKKRGNSEKVRYGQNAYSRLADKKKALSRKEKSRIGGLTKAEELEWNNHLSDLTDSTYIDLIDPYTGKKN